MPVFPQAPRALPAGRWRLTNFPPTSKHTAGDRTAAPVENEWHRNTVELDDCIDETQLEWMIYHSYELVDTRIPPAVRLRLRGLDRGVGQHQPRPVRRRAPDRRPFVLTSATEHPIWSDNTRQRRDFARTD